MSDQWRDELARELLPVFATEAQEDVRAINERLPVLERSEADERERVLADVFRSAHNLKGSSAAANLPEIVEIAGRLETVFKSMQTRNLVLEPQLLDVVHEALDAITSLIRQAMTGEPAEVDVAALSARLVEGQEPRATGTR